MWGEHVLSTCCALAQGGWAVVSLLPGTEGQESLVVPRYALLLNTEPPVGHEEGIQSCPPKGIQGPQSPRPPEVPEHSQHLRSQLHLT